MFCSPVGTSPKTSEQTLPLSTRTGLLAASPDMQDRPKVSFNMPYRNSVSNLIVSKLILSHPLYSAILSVTLEIVLQCTHHKNWGDFLPHLFKTAHFYTSYGVSG